MIKSLITISALLLFLTATGQVSGTVTDEEGKPLKDVMVFIEGTSIRASTDASGAFRMPDLEPGKHRLATFYAGYETGYRDLVLKTGEQVEITFRIKELSQELTSVTIQDSRAEELGISWLQSVSGSAIYEAKKTELIQLDEVIANKAANVSRQVYSRVPGLNIWESDGAGVQLGIGGRGLSPNRTSNFNVRQNGYDISADALGYPESYYTPPVQALDKIEIIRGAAGLQYGTQFGGMLNFDFKEGPKDKKIELETVNTLGSFGLFNSFNSLGGTVGKTNYYGFYQYKTSEGWRPNSGIDQHNVFGSVRYEFTSFLEVKLEYTHMGYLAQQPGGLLDVEFYQNPRQSFRTRNWFQVGWDLAAMEWNYRPTSFLKFNNRTFHLSAKRYAVGNLEPSNDYEPEEKRNLLKDDYSNWGNEFRAIVHYPFLGRKSVFLIGNRLYFGHTNREQGNSNNADNPSFTYVEKDSSNYSSYTFPSGNTSFFVENIFNLSHRFSVTPGIRVEFIRTEANGYFVFPNTDLAGNVISIQRRDEKRNNERSFFILGVGFSYKLGSHELYSNFSQNYRSINFNDIRVINPNLIVDENISDERGYNADLGLRGSKSGVYRYDLSIFYLAYNNRIGNTIVSGSRFRTNVGDASILGIESYFEVDLFDLLKLNPEKQWSLNLFANTAIISGRYLNSEINGVTGNEVELVPRVNLKTGFTFKYKDFGLSWLYSYTARQYSDATNADDSPTAVEGIIPAYSVMDVSASYKWKWLTFQTGVNNLTDNHYFTRRAAGYPGPGIIPSDGRSGYVTVGVRF